MLTFEYEAKDPKSGETIRSQVQAQDEKSAAHAITKQGLAPIEIKSKSKSSKLSRKGRIKTKDKIIFSRQLSTLINAGLPLTKSLRTVSEQSRSKSLENVINNVISSVEGGSTLANALAKHPKIFNEVYVSLVAAGEASGTLDKSLARIADQQEKDAEIQSKVRGAMVYPIIVLVVIAGVLIFMLTTVLPQVGLLYADLNQELPFMTRILLGASNILFAFWWLIIIMMVGFGFFARKYGQTESGRATYDSIKLNFPLFGNMFKKLYMARFCRTGQTLISSGVQVLEMLRITSNAVNNVHVKKVILKAVNKVKGGKSLGDSLSDSPYILSLVPQMISIGEQSGAIDEMMGKAADFYERELDNEVKTISTTIEPALMVILALMAGFMVGAVLLPVYQLVGQSITL